MRSASNARILAGVVLAVALCGCNRVDVNSSSIRGIAYVRTDEVLKHHPLYAQLQKIDDAATAIDLAAAAPRVPRSAAQVAAGIKSINGQLADAQTRANKTLAQKQQEYAQKERDADIAALSAAGIDTSGLKAAAKMSATSQAQAQAAALQANKDFITYQQSVVTQDNAASAAIAMQLQKQAQQAMRARSEQYSQNETDLSLRLAQNDSPQRLALKTKLNNLAMDSSTRASLQAQLSALDKKESSEVDVLKARDRSDLAAYAATLRQSTDAQIHRQVAAIGAQTQAKIASRRDAVGAQIRTLAGSSLPPNVPPDVQKKLAQIHAQYSSEFQTDANGVVQAYNAERADLGQQFAALQGADVGATGAAAKELAALRKKHDDLQAQMIDQIHREAQRIAKTMGFTVVFENVAAAPGGYDLTNDLIHDVESMHE